MDILEALNFINETKQPAAYFEHDGERYRFQNIQIDNDRTIYKYLSSNQEITISKRK